MDYVNITVIDYLVSDMKGRKIHTLNISSAFFWSSSECNVVSDLGNDGSLVCKREGSFQYGDEESPLTNIRFNTSCSYSDAALLAASVAPWPPALATTK